MTKEEKQLLLKDLCERLPYGVKYNFGGNDGCDYIMDRISLIAVDDAFPIEDVKPYLRPMSSMTEEELNVFRACHCVYDVHPNFQPMMCNIPNECNMFDWLIAHHFDYRGLIPMGLALEAPEDMYKIE